MKIQKYKIQVAANAKQDLVDIYDFVFRSDGQTNAKKLFSTLTKKIKSLTTNPARGNYPPELLDIGFKLFREVHFGTYRIIYQINTSMVIVMAIVDGRRDLSVFLETRLLRQL